MGSEVTKRNGPAATRSCEERGPRDAPPGYKKTEVGVIPKDWDIKPLMEVLVRGRLGGNYPTQETDTDFPLIKMGNVGRGRFDLSKVEFIASGVVPDDNHRLRQGDILLNTRNTPELVGKVAIWRSGLPVAYYNSNLMKLEFDPQKVASNEYANYALNSEASVRRLHALATGTTSVAAIYSRDLLRLPFVLPSLSEQRAIAEALSDVDGLLEALDNLIAKKRAIKRAAMQQLLTGETRLPGFRGPWETKRLGNHVRFLRNGTLSRADLSDAGSVKYLHYGDIHTSSDVYLNPSTRTLPTLQRSLTKSLDRLENGDLVLVDASEDIEGVGKALEVKGVQGHEIVAGLHTIAARFDKSVLADGFKAYLQFCPPFRKHIRRLAAGTKVYATQRAHIETVEMPLPTVEEQTAIAAVLSDMDAEIKALEAQRDKVRRIKRGMMQELLTGRIRLVQPEEAA